MEQAYNSNAALKASLVQNWAEISQEIIQKTIDQFQKRLRQCVAAGALAQDDADTAAGDTPEDPPAGEEGAATTSDDGGGDSDKEGASPDATAATDDGGDEEKPESQDGEDNGDGDQKNTDDTTTDQSGSDDGNEGANSGGNTGGKAGGKKGSKGGKNKNNVQNGANNGPPNGQNSGNNGQNGLNNGYNGFNKNPNGGYPNGFNNGRSGFNNGQNDFNNGQNEFNDGQNGNYGNTQDDLDSSEEDYNTGRNGGYNKYNNNDDYEDGYNDIDDRFGGGNNGNRIVKPYNRRRHGRRGRGRGRDNGYRRINNDTYDEIDGGTGYNNSNRRFNNNRRLHRRGGHRRHHRFGNAPRFTANDYRYNASYNGYGDAFLNDYGRLQQNRRRRLSRNLRRLSNTFTCPRVVVPRSYDPNDQWQGSRLGGYNYYGVAGIYGSNYGGLPEGNIKNTVDGGILPPVCKKLKKMVEKRLNKAYAKLRIDVDSVVMDKFFEVMPRQESKHRGHPLNELQSLASIMKRRLDSLGYKFDDPIKGGHCCFYAGKMLDVMVPMLDWINSYLPSLEEIAENTRASIVHFLPPPPDQFNAYDMAVPFTDLDYLLEHQFLKYTTLEIKQHKEQVLSTWKTHKSTYKQQSVTDSSSTAHSVFVPADSKRCSVVSKTYSSSSVSSNNGSLEAIENNNHFWPSNKTSMNLLLALKERMQMSKATSFYSSLKNTLKQTFVILNLKNYIHDEEEDKEQVCNLLQVLGLPTPVIHAAQVSRISWDEMRKTRSLSRFHSSLSSMHCSNDWARDMPYPVKVTLKSRKDLQKFTKALQLFEEKHKNLFDFKFVVQTMEHFVENCVD